MASSSSAFVLSNRHCAKQDGPWKIAAWKSWMRSGAKPRSWKSSKQRIADCTGLVPSIHYLLFGKVGYGDLTTRSVAQSRAGQRKAGQADRKSTRLNSS